MSKIDYEYETSEERVRAYLKIPEIDRLKWLEEIVAFTLMARRAPSVRVSEPSPPKYGSDKT